MAETRFEDPGKPGGGSEPKALWKKEMRSLGPKWMYIFNCRKAKKLIPVYCKELDKEVGRA